MRTQENQETQVYHTDEYQIRHLLKDFGDAMIEGDLEKIMSYYAADVIAYDIMPPLQYVGKKAYQKSWEEAFKMCQEDVMTGYEIRDLKIVVNESIAFAYGLVHNVITPKKGNKMDMWMRSTRCFEKIRGKWLITHEQYSVPVDFQNQKALLDLKPVTRGH